MPTDLEILKWFENEQRCDVICMSNCVAVCVGQECLTLDRLNQLQSDGLVSVRTEEVPCGLMGERIPPIRIVSLTDKGANLLGLVGRETNLHE